jgi:hypothetical protein
MRTIAEPVEGEDVRIEPADTPGITVNSVPADLDQVQKADVRVDLFSGATRSFVVEHVLGPLGLCGVTAAEVTGIRDAWAFERPEHRFCYSRGFDPQHVVGHPAGLPNPAIVEAIKEVGVVTEGEPIRRTVSEPVSLTGEEGAITLRPHEQDAGVRFNVSLQGESLVAEVDPAGETDPDLIERVTNATTPYLAPDPTEAITHAIADLVSDVAVIGGFEDLRVEADLGGDYHELTIGVVRKAHERGVVVEH